eukprot:jgi/Bigna1/126933/aug1.3_g1641
MGLVTMREYADVRGWAESRACKFKGIVAGASTLIPNWGASEDLACLKTAIIAKKAHRTFSSTEWAQAEDQPPPASASWNEFLGSGETTQDGTIKQRVSISEVLSVCIDASLEAAERIRVIYRSNSLYPRPRPGSKDTASMGGFDETVTLCDLEAQRVIMEGIEKVFPQMIKCVGQEGELSDIAFEGEGAKETAERLRREMSGEDIFDNVFSDDYTPTTKLLSPFEEDFPPEILSVDPKDLMIWVDPIDGTDAMLEGLIDVVTTTIGISYKGVPVAGVITKPFKKKMVWGLARVGVGGDLDPAAEEEKEVGYLKKIKKIFCSGNRL